MKYNDPTSIRMIFPGLIVHSDWSKSPQKRWMAMGVYQQDGSYFLDTPQPVNQASNLLAELSRQAPGGQPLLVGFDFPIGLPIAYAQKTGVVDYLTFLRESTTGKWKDFYQVAIYPQEISLSRPFYPAKPGNARQAHLIQALGCNHINQLRRRCEQAHPQRRAAAPLFWTMGAQ